jgi:transposase
MVLTQSSREKMSESKMVQKRSNRYEPFKRWRVHDGASRHAAFDAVRFLSRRCLIVPGWPPNSADMNPIDILWSIAKARMRRKPLQGLPDLT